MMKHSLGVRAFFTASLFVAASSVMAASTTSIPSTVPFADDLQVRDAIKQECQLGEKISQFIAAYGKKAVNVSDSTEGRHLDLAITDMHAPGGGAWSGAKSLEVRGTLMDGETAIASFTALRFTGGGAFGGFKGTCSILGRNTKALGKDIARWLKEPVDGAKLGDAR